MDEELDFVQPHKKIEVNLVANSDAIRREAAIDAMYHHFCDKSREECAQILHEVPSVNPQANNEDIHREREQAYMRGYEDGSRKYRTVQSEDAISRQAAKRIIYDEFEGWPTEEEIVQMKRLIKNLDELPSVSTEKTDAYKQGWHDAMCKALDEAYDIVIDGERFSVVQEETLIGLETAYEQVCTEKTGRWIPVSERLPEEDGQYLITVKYVHVDGYDDIYTEHGEWIDGKWDMFCFGHCGQVETILAWMPLPEPYNGESEDDK